MCRLFETLVIWNILHHIPAHQAHHSIYGFFKIQLQFRRFKMHDSFWYAISYLNRFHRWCYNKFFPLKENGDFICLCIVVGSQIWQVFVSMLLPRIIFLLNFLYWLDSRIYWIRRQQNANEHFNKWYLIEKLAWPKCWLAVCLPVLLLLPWILS